MRVETWVVIHALRVHAGMPNVPSDEQLLERQDSAMSLDSPRASLLATPPPLPIHSHVSLLLNWPGQVRDGEDWRAYRSYPAAGQVLVLLRALVKDQQALVARRGCATASGTSRR